jgi:hypothetical protein
LFQHWLLVRLGAGDLRGHHSTRRPQVQQGDRALCYLAGWQTLFAAVEVVGPPENDPSRNRWQWRFPLRAVLALDDPESGPPVEAAGVWPRSLGRHSYVRLTPEQFEAGFEALQASAR